MPENSENKKKKKNEIENPQQKKIRFFQHFQTEKQK
jgi:hypothetical protein